MVYAALSKGWRRAGKKLVNDCGESATNTATYSVELKVASQAVAGAAGGPEFMLNSRGLIIGVGRCGTPRTRCVLGGRTK
jgi:hypothetical protein